MAPKRGRRRTSRFPLILAAAAASAVLLLVMTTPAAPPPQRDVVIIDTLPNTGPRDFATKSREILEPAGYNIRSHTGRNVTIELIKSLGDTPLLVIRAHSSVFDDGVWFYTGEPYSNTEHVLEQLTNEVHIGRTSPEATPTFAVGSAYIRGSLRGRLNGTIVILMGCDGLARGDLADAFADSGASAIVGWDGPVSVEQTDAATLELLRQLAGGATLADALEAAGKASDGFDSSMISLPAGASGVTLPRG